MPRETDASLMRPEIMALRAVALIAVLTYHLFPARLPGGFAGLDLFFVISGYLVTGILLRMREQSGRIPLGAYMARRARRILPSALVVLAAVLAAAFVLAPITEWRRIAVESLSSALFVENWHLIAASLAYAGPASASPVQHYWTLAVEVQFYLFWALLLMLVLGSRGAPRRRAATAAIAAVLVLSLATSVALCSFDPAAGYLSTATRAWELAVGGLLSVLVRAVPRARIGVPLAVVGWALIAGTFVLASLSTPWPGWAALVPVGGAALVVAAGVAPSAPALFRRANDNVIVRTLADISYAVYLWHWPLLVFADRALGHPPTGPQKLAIAAAALALGWLTTRLVERPVRFGRLAAAPAATTLAASALAIAIVAAPAAAITVTMSRATELYSSITVVADPSLCRGAEARTPGEDCIDGPYRGLSPDPLGDWEQVSVLHGMGCAQGNVSPEVVSCTFGDPGGAMRVALVGDSHGMKLWPPLQRLAEQQGWQLVTYLKSQCEFTAPPGDGSDNCQQWRADVAGRLSTDGPWDLVVTTGASSSTAVPGFAASVAPTWSDLLATGTPVVVVRDVPYLEVEFRACVVDHLDDLSACDRPRAAALLPDALADAASTVPGMSVIDLTDRFCDASTCFAAIGGIITHRDGDHITDEFAVTLAPSIGARLELIAPQLFAPQFFAPQSLTAG